MSWWRVIVTKSKIMTYCVSQIAGKNMRLKWVYINADSNRSFSANSSYTCCSRLASWKGISSPEIEIFFVDMNETFCVEISFMCIEVSCYLRTNCVGMIYVWYHLNISGLLWSTFKYNRNWITGYKIGSLYLIYCIVIRIFLKNKNLYSREHLGGVFLNIVKLSLGVGAQIIKCFIYLQLFWNSSSLVLILPCFQINYWQPCFQRGFEILKRTIMCSYRHNT